MLSILSNNFSSIYQVVVAPQIDLRKSINWSLAMMPLSTFHRKWETSISSYILNWINHNTIVRLDNLGTIMHWIQFHHYHVATLWEQLPFLEVDGEAIYQSRSIERFLARKFGKYSAMQYSLQNNRVFPIYIGLVKLREVGEFN